MRQRGSIVTRRDAQGKFVCYRIKFRRPDGKQAAIGSYKTVAEAQEELTKVMKEMNDGCYIPPTGKTFAEYAEGWLQGRVDVKGSTWENYQSYLKKHVKPFLGKTKMADVRIATVKALIAHLSQKKPCCSFHYGLGRIAKLAANFKSGV